MASGENIKRILFTILAGLLFCLPLNVYCQNTGIKYFENYNRKKYKANSQNWSILQDHRGIIYVGNHTALLEFDGISWRSIDIPNQTVRSMAIDETGTIYIGGDNEIGFLTPDSKGTLKYKSLRDKLTDSKTNFSMVWKTHWTGDSIYFHTSNFLLRWDSKQIKKLKPTTPDTSLVASFYCGGELYIRQTRTGLMRVKGDSLELAPKGETFADKKIFVMVPYDSDSRKLLIGTRFNGFYIYDGTGVERFPIEDGGYVQKNLISHGIRLSSSGDFALTTLQGGLVIIDADGRLKYTFNKEHGLPDNDVKYVFEDSGGNLWLALNKGISKIEYASPFSSYNEQQSNLPGLVQSVTRHGPYQDLYACTTSGLYFLGPDGKFHHISDVDIDCFSILSIGDSLFAATTEGVFRVGPNKTEPIIKHRSYSLLRSPKDTNRVWVGTDGGLVSLYLNLKNENKEKPQWRMEHEFENTGQEIRTIVENQNGDLWLGTPSEGVINVHFPIKGNMMKPDVTKYGKSHQLPGGWGNVFWAAERVIFATGNGIYRFDEKSRTFLPDYTLGDEFAGRQNGIEVFRIVEDKNKHIWLNANSNNIRAFPQPDGTFALKKKPFLRIPTAQVNVIYPDPDGNIVWFGGDDGLIRYDRTINKDYDHDFTTLIRKVTVNGKPVFYGSGHPSPVIDYKDRNIRFEFAAPYFENESAVQYQCLLEEYEKNWSAWASESIRDYTNLDRGPYTFRVRAKNTYGHISGEANFQFKVLPPWFRTWWAFSAYILIIFLLMFRIIKWRSEKLEREKRKLERVVKERTKEIGEKNRQLETQTLQLQEQSEKLKEMDKVKSRFFANISHEFRTPLTLIMGPLEKMLSDTRGDEGKKDLNLMLRNSQRLLGLINQLLELSKFESGKVKLQACRQNILPFLKGITASFEPATDKNELELTFQAEEEDITLYFDPGKLEEVIFNLLSNAVKFTPPGGRITVAAARTDVLEISVSDTGSGIPRDQLTHIFDRFYQADSTYEHHQKGSGIGLSIARELVELHHGKIEARSHEGKGTEFIIRLPLGKEHLESDEIIDTFVPSAPRKTSHIIPAALQPAAADTGETGPEKSEAGIDPLKSDKEIILVVEDSAEVRDYIKGSLEPYYTVLEAGDGTEGIQKAMEIIPDLIISDIMMPGVDGYELCRQLKTDIKTSHIPIVLLTARASEENILQGLETGADDYITKPFNTKILGARIKNLIDLRRHMQQTIDREMSLQPAKMPVSRMDKEFVRKLKKVINENIPDPDFNIEQLCKKMDMSQPTIYRKIHALTGESPTEFIRSYRLKRGAELLKNNFGSVLEVSFEVGFSSASYFTKCFKEKFHQLPSSFQAAEAQ